MADTVIPAVTSQLTPEDSQQQHRLAAPTSPLWPPGAPCACPDFLPTYSLNITAFLDLWKPNFCPKHPTASHQTCRKSRGGDRSHGPLSFPVLPYAFLFTTGSLLGPQTHRGMPHVRAFALVLPSAWSLSFLHPLFRWHHIKPEACPDYFMPNCNPPPRAPTTVLFPFPFSLLICPFNYLSPHKKVNPRRAGILGILHPKQHPKQVFVADGGSEREAECCAGVRG